MVKVGLWLILIFKCTFYINKSLVGQHRRPLTIIITCLIYINRSSPGQHWREADEYEAWQCLRPEAETAVSVFVIYFCVTVIIIYLYVYNSWITGRLVQCLSDEKLVYWILQSMISVLNFLSTGSWQENIIVLRILFQVIVQNIWHPRGLFLCLCSSAPCKILNIPIAGKI